MPGPANANRSERRRLAQRKVGGVPMVRIMDLTMDEAEVVTEALDNYVLAQQELCERRNSAGELIVIPPTPVQAWAMDRAGEIRDLLQAALDGKPWHDSGSPRHAPVMVAPRVEPDVPSVLSGLVG